jgi:hypothetical protein
MKCPECESENTVSHTDKELRSLNLLVHQCFDCENKWESNLSPYWDVDEND